MRWKLSSTLSLFVCSRCVCSSAFQIASTWHDHYDVGQVVDNNSSDIEQLSIHAVYAASAATMTLVYHGTPTLYPEHAAGPSSSSASNIAAIRFPHPIRLQSIRVIPEGVEHPTGVG